MNQLGSVRWRKLNHIGAESVVGLVTTGSPRHVIARRTEADHVQVLMCLPCGRVAVKQT